MTNVIKRIPFFVCLFILQIPSHSAKAVSNSVNADTVKVTLLNGVPAIDVKKRDLGTIHVGDKVDASVLLFNRSKYRLEIADLVVSDPAMKLAPSQSWMIPEMKICLNGYVRFKTPRGKFRITAKVYYKGVKKPTIVVYEGNVIK